MRNWRRLRRSKRLKKNVRFENDAFAKQGNPRKMRAIRSLFTSCSFCELPNEVVSVILSYFTATELMRLRCVSTAFFFLAANEIVSNRMNFYDFKFLLILCIPKDIWEGFARRNICRYQVSWLLLFFCLFVCLFVFFCHNKPKETKHIFCPFRSLVSRIICGSNNHF